MLNVLKNEELPERVWCRRVRVDQELVQLFLGLCGYKLANNGGVAV